MVRSIQDFSPSIPAEVRVESMGVEGTADFVRASIKGWQHSKSAEEFLGDVKLALELYGESLRCYVAYIGDTPVGSGLMRMFTDCPVEKGLHATPPTWVKPMLLRI
jgi:hypothetical protein